MTAVQNTAQLPHRRSSIGLDEPVSTRGAVSCLKASAEAIEEAFSLVVWKFGGTSVADYARLRMVAERLVSAQRQGHRVVAVLSAMGHSTDELAALAYGMSELPPQRELDALLSVGEVISCALASIAVHELGCQAVSLTGAQAGIITDDRYGNARVHTIDPRRIFHALDDGAIVLITGFQGVSDRGDVTTMGRGGSDASAVALAAALGVPQCDIFTDVAGVFTADPRVAPDARRLSSLYHEEMLELAEAGTAVLQPQAVELAMDHGIDIHLRSSLSAETGTWIRKRNGAFGTANVAGIAHRHQDSLYCARGVSPATASSGLAQRSAAVGVIVHVGDELRFTAPWSTDTEVMAALRAVGAEVQVHDKLGTVSVVGTGIARKSTIIARTLSALEAADIQPHLVTTTSGRVSVHISTTLVDHAVRVLHHAFIAQPTTPASPPHRHRSVPRDHRGVDTAADTYTGPTGVGSPISKVSPPSTQEAAPLEKGSTPSIGTCTGDKPISSNYEGKQVDQIDDLPRPVSA